MPLLEALLLAGLALGGEATASEVRTVVTFDNGEFDLPLYTPRHNGKWSLPSVAQEMSTSVARIAGENPLVYTYLPPGRTAGRPGAPYLVAPRQARCEGPAESPSDPCWCGPADKCWDELGPNYHPEASTSLYLTAAAMREALRGEGPRIEVHVSDLFEEDPSAADDPADSDRCVTLDGTRKALAGLVRLPAGESLDHLAVGVMRVRVDAPPPGGSWGYTYRLRPEQGSACWSGVQGPSWEAGRAPYDMAMAVIVLGVDTAAHAQKVDAFVDGLQGQLTSEEMQLELVRLREPPTRQVVETAMPLGELVGWSVAPPESPPRLPCDEVSATADLLVGSRPLTAAGIGGLCDGGAAVALPVKELERGFLRDAGLDPRVESTIVSGRIRLQGDDTAVLSAFRRLDPVASDAADRPLPLWNAMGRALGLPPDGDADHPWRPWTHDIEIRRLEISGVDTRPWLLAAVGSLASALAAALAAYLLLEKVHADRAFQTHWDRNIGPGKDPLRQRPLAAILAEAQEDVRRRWGQRVAVALGVGLSAALLAMWLFMKLHLVRLG